MKNFLFIISMLLLQTSCEDVIELNLNTTEPKLVIEASINWLKGTSGNEQIIKLSLTAPYFDKNIPPANGAIVSVTDQDNNTYYFIEDGETGIYKTTNFKPILDHVYTLEVVYNNETYSGKEIFKSVVPLDFIEQNNEGGFTGKEIELKAYYTDPPDEKNFYFFEFRSNTTVPTSISIYEDRFTNGNQIFGFYSEEHLKVGDNIMIRNYGISEQFYNYMYILLQQNSDSGGSPFETQPTSVRGNCSNQSNPENFPLGYFRLSEVVELVYTIQ